MARECDTTKYRKRRRKEKLNAAARRRRLALQEAQYREKCRKIEAERRAAWLRDPKRQQVQRLVNVLRARLMSDPLYQVLEISKVFGINGERILDAVASGDESVLLPPGHVWLKEGSPGSGRYA